MTEEVKVVTADELIGQLKAALDKGDFNAVKKISGEIAKAQKAEEKAEEDKKGAAVAELTKVVHAKLNGIIQKMVDDGKLDGADGVWYSWDFGDTTSTCKLLKKAAAKTGGGGGGGKKFDVKTSDLLAQHGGEVMDAETGKTYQQAWDENTEGNSRYAVRVKLIKLAAKS